LTIRHYGIILPIYMFDLYARLKLKLTYDILLYIKLIVKYYITRSHVGILAFDVIIVIDIIFFLCGSI